MNRFEWSSGTLIPGEKICKKQDGVRLYDGENKTMFDHGTLAITSHHLLWSSPNDGRSLALRLALIVFLEEEKGSFSKSDKIILHLSQPPPGHPPGPTTYSSFSHIKLAFKEGGETIAYSTLHTVLQQKAWEHSFLPSVTKHTTRTGREVRAGIVGIERKLEERQKETDASISHAFEDLKNLMVTAKEMVSLSRNISERIREKHGDITEDETVRFKSYLLSLGIDDPVTKDSHGSGNVYYKELAKQLASVLLQPITEAGGMMALPDVYCRVNRARGLELLSPEDLLNACQLLDSLHLPVILRRFDSGVLVLQLHSHNEQEVVAKTAQALQDQKSLTAEELSRIEGVSVILARERLLECEKLGKACRDDCVEGLCFYPNYFLLSR